MDGALDEASLTLKLIVEGVEIPVGVELLRGSLEYHTDEFTAIRLSWDSVLPVEFSLKTPFPNPFNSTVRLDFAIASEGVVSLAIYDVAGRKVADLVSGVRTVGVHSTVWNAKNQPSGVYLVRLSSGSEVAVGKMTLVR